MKCFLCHLDIVIYEQTHTYPSPASPEILLLQIGSKKETFICLSFIQQIFIGAFSVLGIANIQWKICIHLIPPYSYPHHWASTPKATPRLVSLLSFERYSVYTRELVCVCLSLLEKKIQVIVSHILESVMYQSNSFFFSAAA